MIKVNRNVHMLILLTFALVFVIVYLYYTINDVKKLSIEVKKNAQDIQGVATSLANLNKAVNELKVNSAVCVKQVCTSPLEQVEEESEDESEPVEEEITQDDMKKLLNEIPSSDSESEKEENEPLDEEELKKLKLEDIKALCKERDISTKGNKDQLIAKLCT